MNQHEQSARSENSGGQMGSETGQSAKDVGKRIKKGAREAVSQVKEQAASTMHKQRDVAAERLHSVSEAIRNSAGEMGQGQDNAVSHIARQAADQIDSLSEYLRDHDMRDIVNSVEDWARRNPVLFFSVAIGAGVVLSRFLKSSQDRIAGREGGGYYGGAAGYGSYESSQEDFGQTGLSGGIGRLGEQVGSTSGQLGSGSIPSRRESESTSWEDQ